jgi:hypothetical protein
MTIKHEAGAILELLIVTILFTFAMQTLIGNFAGVAFASLDQTILMRLTLFAASCLIFGLWVRIRLNAALEQAAIAFALGVITFLWITTRINDLGMPASVSDWAFSISLILVTWALLFAGVFIASRRTKRTIGQ